MNAAGASLTDPVLHISDGDVVGWDVVTFAGGDETVRVDFRVAVTASATGHDVYFEALYGDPSQRVTIAQYGAALELVRSSVELRERIVSRWQRSQVSA